MGIMGIPLWLFWSVGGIAVAVGLVSILIPGRIQRCMRLWLIRQMRMIRKPGYLRYLKLNGWLLFVLGTLMLVLLATYFPGRTD